MPDVPGWNAPGLGYPSNMERMVERENKQLRTEIEHLRAMLRLIASSQSVFPSDIVDIAKRALSTNEQTKLKESP